MPLPVVRTALVRTALVRTAVGAAAALLLATGCSAGTDATAPVAAASSAADDAYPVTLDHQFGRTTIEERPARVVTVGFNEQDFALAVGVVPVGVREFLGYDAPSRPWAADLLPAEELPTVGAEELDVEAVAALQPDVILAINSYVDEETYGLLSKIAPTVAQTDAYAEGATPWDVQTLTTGEALGEGDAAEEAVERTRAAIDAAAEAHPEFDGATASFALGGAYSLGADDYRTGWLTELGFQVPAKGGEVSDERLDAFDTDVLLLEGVTSDLTGKPVFRGLDAVAEGRVVDLGGFDEDFAGALGFGSPLSLPYVLEVAVPRLAAAVDGDRTTPVAAYPGP